VNEKIKLLFKKPFISVVVFFLLYLSIGLSVYKDYGISLFEPIQRYHGIVSTSYIASVFLPSFHPPDFVGLPQLANYNEKEYGVIFDVPMYAAEVLLGYNTGDPARLFYLRHLCTFLLFYASVFFFFLIVRDRFNSWTMGLAGALFLILSPRIFAESFYNIKDIVFLSFFIIAIYFFIRFLNNKTIANSFLFALASAFAVDQRMPGVIIPLLAIMMSVVDAIKEDASFKGKIKSLFPLLMYLILSAIFVVLFWPYLWENPVKNFINAFVYMSRYPWLNPVLYMGKFIKATELPWHYIPVWLLITTPVIYIVFFLIGFIRVAIQVMKNGHKLYSDAKERQDFLFLLLFLVPLASVIILRSVLYDGWRQMYFIYAPFLLIALEGLSQTLSSMGKIRAGFRSRIAISIVLGSILLSVVTISYQTILNHPYQEVYFNFLAGNNIGQNFERDYWGLSYRQGLEYIVKNDKRPIIKVSANSNEAMLNNELLLEEQDARRLMAVSPQQADYFLTGFRWDLEQYENANEIFKITAYNMKIMSIFGRTGK